MREKYIKFIKTYTDNCWNYFTSFNNDCGLIATTISIALFVQNIDKIGIGPWLHFPQPGPAMYHFRNKSLLCV